jgi:hypothetical protein
MNQPTFQPLSEFLIAYGKTNCLFCPGVATRSAALGRSEIRCCDDEDCGKRAIDLALFSERTLASYLDSRSKLPCSEHQQAEATVTLHFKSEEQKKAFLGQFSDGWGENYINYDVKGDDLFVREVCDPSCQYSDEEWL